MEHNKSVGLRIFCIPRCCRVGFWMGCKFRFVRPHLLGGDDNPPVRKSPLLSSTSSAKSPIANSHSFRQAALAFPVVEPGSCFNGSLA